MVLKWKKKGIIKKELISTLMVLTQHFDSLLIKYDLPTREFFYASCQDPTLQTSSKTCKGSKLFICAWNEIVDMS
jgi:hypothetical protein